MKTLIILFHMFTVSNDKLEINKVIDNLHIYASIPDGEKYFELFDDSAIFYGTDAKERWNITEFKNYANDRFRLGTGWTYYPISRNIYLNENTAWFDEEIKNEKYGIFRGSGVLVKKNNKWLITQYNLLLPIPNELLIEYSQEIKRFLKNDN